MFWKIKRTNKEEETSAELGNGNAEFLGVGTYEEYAKEEETEQAWSAWIRNTLRKL